MKEALVKKLQARTATVGVVGLGYVGLPLAISFANSGLRVVGFDVDEAKVSELSKGRSYIDHIPSDRVREAVKHGFSATTQYAKAHEADALVICVPTPLGRHREPDLSYVRSTMDSLVPHARRGQVLVLESTTYPGTTEEELVPRVERHGYTVGADFFVAYSPEREDPGNADFTISTIPKVVSGVTEHCADIAEALYATVAKTTVRVSSVKAAEMTKLLENIHRAVNIGLVNEMKIVADRMGIDIHEVIRAAATKPFGFTPYYPGPGLGGHCIPIDPFYLTWKAREFGVNTRFIELAGEVNTAMPEWVVGKIADALNVRETTVYGAHVLVLGIAYKKNVGDMRESPAVRVMELLQDKGAKIAYSDPHVPVFPQMREHHFDLASETLTSDFIESQDVVVLATDHDDFDYDFVLRHAKLVVDTRGRFTDPHDHVVNA